jgi:putative iron-only hydrogenase system regulator
LIYWKEGYSLADSEVKLMEKRIGAILIIVEDRNVVTILNNIISQYSEMILGRQGIPLRDKELHIISLVIEGSTDEIGAITGKLGRLKGISVKSVVIKDRKEVPNAI